MKKARTRQVTAENTGMIRMIRLGRADCMLIAPEEIPSRYWRPQAPKLDQEGLTKAVRAREKALGAATQLSDTEERRRALEEVETLYPPIPGVVPSNGGITLTRRV